MVLGAVLSMLRYVAGSEDRDFVDRLHSYFTCNILIGLAVLVSFKQFGGKPIECLVPDIFSSSWEQYAENYCWAQDTYYVPMGEAVAGMPDDDRRKRQISYYQVRVMGNVQEHTVQCVLIINIFNEKIFIFLWFWYMMLALFTSGSFLYWLFVAVIPYPNRRFVKRHLEISEMPFDPAESDEDVRRFIDNYLKSDGVFVLRMLTLQSGVIFGTDLVLSLWKSYFGIEEKLKRSNSMPHVADGTEEPVTRYWPPPPARDLGRERMRNALGQNIDNSLVSQDILERIVPPYRTNRVPRYVATVNVPLVDHQEDNEANEALIRNLDSVSVRTAPPAPIPPSTLIQRIAAAGFQKPTHVNFGNDYRLVIIPRNIMLAKARKAESFQDQSPQGELKNR
ncbi:Innexin [Teladorsagia circumcincta]|uniref:Innexin n=1 Tax=Teladorsagia circumcincta TaxID=45464 RepID=A0A2G9UTS1_TELCI|nr:Innexin [Teladorsagia circumcincta]